MLWFEIGVLDMNKRQMKKFVKRRQIRLKKNTRFNWDLPTDHKVFSIDPQIIAKDYSIKHHYRYSIKLITLTNWLKRVNKKIGKREMKKEFMFDKNINKIKGGEHIDYPSSLIINFSDHTAVARGHRLTNESSLVNIQDPVDGNVYMETVHDRNKRYEGAFVAPESLFKDKTCINEEVDEDE